MNILVEAIMRFIDGVTEPDKLDTKDAFEVLETVRNEIAMRMEALRDEMRDAG